MLTTLALAAAGLILILLLQGVQTKKTVPEGLRELPGPKGIFLFLPPFPTPLFIIVQGGVVFED